MRSVLISCEFSCGALLLILPLMCVWVTTTYATARFGPRGNEVQVVVLVAAFGVLLLGATIPDAFDATAADRRAAEQPPEAPAPPG